MSEQSDLRDRMRLIEGRQASHAEDMRRVYERIDRMDETIADVQKLALDHEREISPERERRKAWKEDRRQVARSVIAVVILAVGGWLALIMGNGFRGQFLKWLAVSVSP